jgi:hypothetical protein
MEGVDGEDGSHPAAIPSKGERVDSRMEGAGGDCFPSPALQLWIPSVFLRGFPFLIRRGSVVSLQWGGAHDVMCRRGGGGMVHSDGDVRSWGRGWGCVGTADAGGGRRGCDGGAGCGRWH